MAPPALVPPAPPALVDVAPPALVSLELMEPLAVMPPAPTDTTLPVVLVAPPALVVLPVPAPPLPVAVPVVTVAVDVTLLVDSPVDVPVTDVTALWPVGLPLVSPVPFGELEQATSAAVPTTSGISRRSRARLAAGRGESTVVVLCRRFEVRSLPGTPAW